MKKMILVIMSFFVIVCSANASHRGNSDGGSSSSSSTTISASSDRSFARSFNPTELNIAWYSDSYPGLPLAPSKSAFKIKINDGERNGKGRFVEVWAQDYATGNTMSCTMTDSNTSAAIFNAAFAEMKTFTPDSAISVWHNNGVCTNFRLSGRIIY